MSDAVRRAQLTPLWQNLARVFAAAPASRAMECGHE